MTTITSKIRFLVDDNLVTENQYETYSTTAIFDMQDTNVVVISAVYKNDVLMSTGYSYSSSTNKLTITATLTSGDNIHIVYTCYKKYSDTEIQKFLRGALIWVSVEGYDDFTVDEENAVISSDDEDPTEAEENLIALIASILIDGGVKSYRTPEISMVFTEDDSKDTRIRKVINAFSNGWIPSFTFIDMTEGSDTYDD